MLQKYIKKLNKNNEIYLRIKVHPCALKNEIKDIMDDETIKINIKAKAEKGQANKELISFLAKIFSVFKNNVKILSGAKDKIKLIKIYVN